MSHVGIKIKFAREQRGLTQKQLADSINKTRPLITQIERTGLVNQITLNQILGALGMKLEELINGETSGDQRYWYLHEEMTRLRAENQMLKEELNTIRELARVQGRLIMMLEKAISGITD